MKYTVYTKGIMLLSYLQWDVVHQLGHLSPKDALRTLLPVALLQSPGPLASLAHHEVGIDGGFHCHGFCPTKEGTRSTLTLNNFDHKFPLLYHQIITYHLPVE